MEFDALHPIPEVRLDRDRRGRGSRAVHSALDKGQGRPLAGPEPPRGEKPGEKGSQGLVADEPQPQTAMAATGIVFHAGDG